MLRYTFEKACIQDTHKVGLVVPVPPKRSSILTEVCTELMSSEASGRTVSSSGSMPFPFRTCRAPQCDPIIPQLLVQAEKSMRACIVLY